LVFVSVANTQDTIRLMNGSFEDVPKRGDVTYWAGIKNWTDCAPLNDFAGESPPDIHPNGFWENNLPASDGKTYLGLVTRDNDTYESVGQRLSAPLLPGKCYAITIHLARAERYLSRSRLTEKETNYTIPIVLRIWGGTTLCQEMELLAESQPVTNHSWQIYSFKLKPKQIIQYITLSAFYKTPVFPPYCGNLLVDGASHIVRISCKDEAPLIVNNEGGPKAKPKTTKPAATKPATGTGSAKNNTTASASKKEDNSKPKIMTELSRTNFRPGETLSIKNLHFPEDSAVISQASYPVLDEIYLFMMKNKNIVIEIGGHTNNIPKDEYCDRLSTKRAKVVAEYLIQKGIPPERVQFKGYGKRNPIADNRTITGRRKNQRVEIKILST
jgi:outer membrane protein OmpA-like peptidoglycan-associated protein